MSTINKVAIAEDLCFELIDRIVRFYQHIKRIEEEFYSPDIHQNPSVEDILIFLKSYNECLIKVIELSSNLMTKINVKANEEFIESSIGIFENNLEFLNQLHSKYLRHLPRPSAPIELRRFSRIISKQLANIENISSTEEHDLGNKRISIYINEEPVDETYLHDPLYKYKREELNQLISDYNIIANSENLEEIKSISIKLKETNSQTLHVKIPRIDANNPCRWPTLIHELAHHVMEVKFQEEGDIASQFRKNLTEGTRKLFEEYFNDETISLRHWLTECWCDLLAALIIGPSLWFSQYSAFLFNGEISNSNIKKKYPPKLFRLKLIERLIFHRLIGKNFKSFEKSLQKSNRVIEYLDKRNVNGFFNPNSFELKNLFIAFENYFFGHFFKEDNIRELKNIFEPLVKYSLEIDPEIVNKFVTNLSKGFPIPSRKKIGSEILEEPSTVQEILISGWIYRNGNFKQKILENYRDIPSHECENNEEISIEKKFQDDIVSKFDRFDESILKSIQVSEWFDLLDPISNEKESLENINAYIDRIKNHNPSTSVKSKLLTDHQIYDLLIKDKLSILPIINIKEQLGSSSFDIRLGTSFQLYYPSQSGLINFINEETLNDADYNSKIIDLDFLNSITIAPKQFMLAHSMEYLKLPNSIAAEIEGRSSLARLGLEIHMTAGFVDPGFEGTLTLEIYNGGANSIRLYPGIRIGQLRFLNVTPPSLSYNNRETAKYKGLLKHHRSLQFKDQEIELIREELRKQNSKND